MISIVFGWNHFRIRSFSPFELGITQKTDIDFNIELRQRYFHFFWIPFFSLGKKWAIRKGGKLYEMPPVIADAIKTRGDLRVKTPWYTYSGPIVLLLFALGFTISEKVEDFRDLQYSKRAFTAAYVSNSAMFRKPSPYDYYTLVDVKGYAQKYARITGLDKQHIQLSYINNNQASAYSPAGIAALFDKYSSNMETITINRSDSGKVICGDYDKRSSIEGISIKDNYGTQNYRVQNIVRLDGPMFESGSMSRYSGECNMSIKNNGLETTITKIETVEGNIKWSTRESLPLTLKAEDQFSLSGKGENNRYKVKITCTDIEGKEISFMLEGEDFERKISRVIGPALPV
jgi:hypothetical protein